jgi:hypothetical protein
MTSKDILYSKGKNDECYTPAYAVKPILKYIPKGAVVWCPFDKEDSEFVKLISKQNKVIFSHIHNGQDFYEYEPKEHWDCIVSNPPFTNKRLIFERALSFGKPFALIMSNTWLNDAAPKQVFKEKQLELLMLEQRINFISPTGEDMGRPTFSSSYYCHNFLPKQIIFEKMEM